MGSFSPAFSPDFDATAVPPVTAPCGWNVDPAALGVCSNWAGYPAPLQTAALHLASLFLWAATGRRYGPCPITVRPAQEKFSDPAYREYPVWPGQDPAVSGPYLFGGVWRNCGCGSSCCCRPLCSVVLRGPVHAITEVLVNGGVVAPSAYRIDVIEGIYHLVRLDGVCWPTCQDFSADEDMAGAFTVSYEVGLPLPPALEVAAAILACEYAKGMSGATCRLPAKMTRLSRQGVEVEVEPRTPDDDRTGIREVDDVINALNPGKRRGRPVVMSPDLPEHCDRVTTIYPGS